MNISELINHELIKLENGQHRPKVEPKSQLKCISSTFCDSIGKFLKENFSEYIIDVKNMDNNLIEFSLGLNKQIHARHNITFSCNGYFYDFDHVKSYKNTDELIPLIVKDIAKIIYDQKNIEKNSKARFWKFCA